MYKLKIKSPSTISKLMKKVAIIEDALICKGVLKINKDNTNTNSSTEKEKFFSKKIMLQMMVLSMLEWSMQHKLKWHLQTQIPWIQKPPIGSNHNNQLVTHQCKTNLKDIPRTKIGNPHIWGYHLSPHSNNYSRMTSYNYHISKTNLWLNAIGAMTTNSMSTIAWKGTRKPHISNLSMWFKI